MPVGGEVVGPGVSGGASGGGGSGTVTTISVATANGFAGTVANATTTPVVTMKTTITGLLKGNGTAVSEATVGTDYSAGTSALATGIVKSTTATGVLSIAVAGTDYVAPAGNLPSTFNLSTITADPAPGVVGTYYRTNYAGSGNFTLPTTPATGSWIWIKQVANNTLSIVGTVDGNASFTMVQYQSYLFIYNGTNWDIN